MQVTSLDEVLVATDISTEVGSVLKKRIAYDGSGNAEYVGVAIPGTSVFDPRWRISRITYDGSGNAINVDFANGDAGFKAVWQSRESYQYN